MRSRFVFVLVLFISTSLAAKEPLLLSLKGDFAQGGLVIGQAAPKAQVEFNGTQLKISDDGYFVFGFHRDHEAAATLTLTKGSLKEVQPIHIRKRQYNIERVDGLPPSKVNPIKPEVLKRIRKEGAMVAAARAKTSDLRHFMQDFIWPAKGRLSGFYGSQRVLNGDPKRPHYGVDVAAPTGTPVVAPADGIVRLAYDNMFYSGGTLIVDHGFGVSSTFIHLNSIDVEEGQVVKQGDLIATIGATGRATGPHLDWRINWFKSRLDPQLMAPPFEGNNSDTKTVMEEGRK
ncbi:M23 family metallopeptidase [Kangiella sp. HZ709]|uniref:M23 family metallopeptidase n=1 Tax=Kangiella sp. HZ709 TaxID=2666328 RepID=UPI0012B0122B|nr:M23 family metallopeptidase [Kangiella sp. HZ709]MRX26780.1 peptidoglycan DD-metalloendopeptidase family protein [Kangiella sp. HZ709]